MHCLPLTWFHRRHYDESPVCVHLISGVAALNNKPNLRARIRIYLVTFFPGQFNQMSFYPIVYGQAEFQLRENSTWVADFLWKFLLISFWFFFAVKPHNEMEIGMSILLLLAASDLGFWINETGFFIRAAWITQAGHCTQFQGALFMYTTMWMSAPRAAQCSSGTSVNRSSTESLHHERGIWLLFCFKGL